jgi:hypothetical protein
LLYFVTFGRIVTWPSRRPTKRPSGRGRTRSRHRRRRHGAARRQSVSGGAGRPRRPGRKPDTWNAAENPAVVSYDAAGASISIDIGYRYR